MKFQALTHRFLIATAIGIFFTISVAEAQCPVAANCNPTNPPASTLSFGFGIQNVTLGSLNHTTAVNSTSGVQNGYQNFSCSTGVTLIAGASYPISISTNPNIAENLRVFIDYNNDGVFTLPTEQAFSSNTAMVHTGSLVIPGTAVINTPLRMRVVSEFTGASSVPTPCMALEYGQAEDYFVIVQPNTQPAQPDFTTTELFTCDGSVTFTDLSQNIPTSWAWDFGDPASGAANTSTAQNPTHTFSAPGVYTISLTACNANGCNTEVKTNYITFNNQLPVAASCTPSTLNYCCGYGIYNVTFAGINNSSSDGVAGYENFTCPVRTTLVEGLSYPISVQTSAGNNQNTAAWIDFNNDGTFSTSENVFTSLNSINPSGTVTIPLGTVVNTALRMRVVSDFAGGTITACGNQQSGQAEDYTVTIIPNTFPPVASFSIAQFATCDTIRQFTNTTQINAASPATTYLWNFGDGDTSTAQNPAHAYSSTTGNYTVSLIACNSFGCDTVSVANAVIINNPCLNYCTPSNNNNTGQWISQVEYGTINNLSGGGNNGYTNFTNIATTIIRGTPTNYTVSLGTQELRSISIWIDYNRNGVFETTERIVNNTSQLLPSGFRGRAGTITIPAGTETGATRMRVILRANINGNNPCISNAANTDVEDYTIYLQNPPPVIPVPAMSSNQAGICTGLITFQDMSLNSPTSWTWDFGDGSPVSNLQNPSHIYQISSPATYTVTLTACNAAGCSTLTQPDYVVITTPCTTPYCESEGHNNSAQHIAKVAVGTINNTTTAEANGYGNYTTQNTEVLIGAQTALTIELANSNVTWQIAAWIDYNHNATFETTERVFFGGSIALTGGGFGRTGTFTVPTTATPGPTLMRIIGRQGINTNACAMNLTSAETEDYIVHLVTEAAINVGVTAISAPATGCALSSVSPVCISIQNFGTAAQVNIPVRFTVNNIQSPLEIIPGPIAPDSVIEYCFSATANLAAAASYTISAQTFLSGDAQLSNDDETVSVTSFPLPNSNFTYTGNGLEYTFTPVNFNGASYLWDFGDGTTASTAVNPVHQFPANGNYMVTLSVVSTSGCISSTTQTITGVSGSEDLLSHQVSVYPNPSSEGFYVHVPAESGVEIINQTGQVILRTLMQEGENRINLQKQPAGIYLIKINCGEATVYKKLVLW